MFNSKRLTKKQLKELREQHPETLYPLVGYHYELYNMIKEATDEGRKIICKDNGGFFLATEEEAKIYEEKLLKEALKSFAEYWTVHNKIKANGQGVFIDADGKPIDEKSHAKRFIESFVEKAVANAFEEPYIPGLEDDPNVQIENH